MQPEAKIGGDRLAEGVYTHFSKFERGKERALTSKLRPRRGQNARHAIDDHAQAPVQLAAAAATASHRTITLMCPSPVAVPARLTERVARDEEPRSGKDTLRNSLLERETRTPTVPDGRESALKHGFALVRLPQGGDRSGGGHSRLQVGRAGDGGEVDVVVDQAWGEIFPC